MNWAEEWCLARQCFILFAVSVKFSREQLTKDICAIVSEANRLRISYEDENFLSSRGNEKASCLAPLVPHEEDDSKRMVRAHLKFDNPNTSRASRPPCRLRARSRGLERDPRLGWLILAGSQRGFAFGRARERTGPCVHASFPYVSVHQARPLDLCSPLSISRRFTPIDNDSKGSTLFASDARILSRTRRLVRGTRLVEQAIDLIYQRCTIRRHLPNCD